MTSLRFIVVDPKTGDSYESVPGETGKVVLCGEDISLLAKNRECAWEDLLLAIQHFPDRKWKLMIVTVSRQSMEESRWW